MWFYTRFKIFHIRIYGIVLKDEILRAIISSCIRTQVNNSFVFYICGIKNQVIIFSNQASIFLSMLVLFSDMFEGFTTASTL